MNKVMILVIQSDYLVEAYLVMGLYAAHSDDK